ncbi:DNA-binding GntR family transcriptional regulator [Paraburkholderia sp. JPY171]|nr:DNA-binding GntR family transcriptional regulator [Paraburkholderia atlantica]
MTGDGEMVADGCVFRICFQSLNLGAIMAPEHATDNKVQEHRLPSDTEMLQFLIDNHAVLLNLTRGGSREGIAEAMRNHAIRNAGGR